MTDRHEADYDLNLHLSHGRRLRAEAFRDAFRLLTGLPRRLAGKVGAPVGKHLKNA